MFSLKQFEKLRENNQLEVKQALQGIPNSVWETYSSFCNSYGGTILLGVGEKKNKTLYTSGLTEIEINNLLKNFWDAINNPAKVSINLLSDKDVQIHQINNDYILVINIPQADKSYKPVYINNNPLFAFRRNHEGDYRCTKAEIQAMLRDQEECSNDSYIIESMDLSVINKDTLEKYRTGYNQHHKEDHPFVKEDDENFLIHIGAAKRGNNGIIHPTRAGLLMFGNFYDITDIYPNYFLDYQDYRNLEGDDMRWSFRITSTNGDWSGNLYDFYYRIAFKLTEDIAVPFKMKGIFRDDSSPMKKAIREALCNTLSNADYHGELGLVIKQYHDRIIFSNPGVLAMPLEQIMVGGESRARNRTILNIFSFVNIGERAGSGFPLILKAAKEYNYPEPDLFNKYNPDVTKLTVFINKKLDEEISLGIDTENLGIDAENLGIDTQNLGINTEYLGIDTQNLGIDTENLGIDAENLGIDTQNLGIDAENLGIDTQNLGIDTQNLGIDTENLGIDTQKLGIDTENLGIDISTPKLIESLEVKPEIINILKLLFDTFKKEVFGNIDLQILLKISKNTATSYIKLLKENDLIEPVSGHGKGKYKFK